MPATAATASRQILIRLHELMASRANAQAKLDQVTDIIGNALD